MSLLERSQSILDQYQSQQLHGTQLKSELQARIDEASLKQSEDITQHTSSSNGDSTFAFVQHDPSRLAKDVSSQQDFTRRVKLMWSESNTLRKFTAHLMDPNSQDVSLVECKEAEDLRLNAKAELKSWKAAAQSRRDLLLRTSEALDSELQQLSPQVDQVQSLTRDIRGKELELSSLVHGRPAHERITAAEAEAKLEDQVTQLRTASSQLDTGRSALTASQAELAVLKKEVEALSQERVSATRAAEAARKNAKDVDGSLAKAHGWLQAAYNLLSGLMGVSNLDCTTPDCLRVTYSNEQSVDSSSKTLALFFGPNGLQRAELKVRRQLENSVLRIDEFVNEAKQTGDVRVLVHGVRRLLAP